MFELGLFLFGKNHLIGHPQNKATLAYRPWLVNRYNVKADSVFHMQVTTAFNFENIFPIKGITWFVYPFLKLRSNIRCAASSQGLTVIIHVHVCYHYNFTKWQLDPRLLLPTPAEQKNYSSQQSCRNYQSSNSAS